MTAISQLLTTFGALLEQLPGDEASDGCPALSPYRAAPGEPDAEPTTTQTRRYRLRLIGCEREQAGATAPDRVRAVLRLDVPYPLAAAPHRAARVFERELAVLRRIVDDPALRNDPRLRLLVLTDSAIETGKGPWLRFTHRLVALVDQTDSHGEEP